MGGRIYPWRHFADYFLWMMMIRIIAVLELTMPLDEREGVVEPTGEYLSSHVSLLRSTIILSDCFIFRFTLTSIAQAACANWAQNRLQSNILTKVESNQ